MPSSEREPLTGSGQTGETAVVVLGHGSRADGAGRSLERTAESLSRRMGLTTMPASLQFNRPTLAESCGELVAAGAGRIVIVPFFLFNGNHIRRDIPEEIAALKQEHPGVEFILTAPLGEDGRLVELLAERAGEAMAEEETAGAGSGGPHPIEAESFTIIDGLLQPEDPADPAYQIIRRVVHTTGDPDLGRSLELSAGAVAAGRAAVAAGAPVICDVNMAAAGIGPTARSRGIRVLCAVADGATRRLARSAGITRSAAALRRLAAGQDPAGLEGAVIAVGNAPTALLECLELCRQGRLQPSLVVGVPVGFVGAAESKEALAASRLEYITLPGNRGGSAIAAAIVNAIIRLEG